MLKNNIIFFLFLSISNISNVALAQTKRNINYTFDALYGLKVKQVDEFIDRFNNESRYVEKGVFRRIKNPSQQRKMLIKTLFNEENQWDTFIQNEFLSTVTSSQRPLFLSFYDQSWFAKVSATVLFRGEKNELELTLRVQIMPDLSSKWVIIGARAPFLHLPDPKSKSAHINPSNHNVRFSKLPTVMQDTVNLRNYVNSEFREDRLTLLFYEIMHDNLRIDQINEISYHFLQLQNWLMVVRKFDRKSRNAGWLIDELKKVSWEQKRQYLVEELNLY